MVTNELRVNEELDPAAIIRRLKQEVGRLCLSRLSLRANFLARSGDGGSREG
jgi:hypothetical protein